MRKRKNFWKKCCSIALATTMTIGGVMPYAEMVTVDAAQGDTFDINREISKRFTTESLVMLRNNEKVLPLNADDQIAVFGAAQMNTFKTVFGSGSTEGIGIGFVNSMDELKTKVKVDQELEHMYREFARTNPPDRGQIFIDNEILSQRSIPEMALTDEIVQNASKRNNKAVVFIGRTNGEGYDWQLENEYELRAEEKQMLDLVTKYFDKVTVVLNTASPIDMSWDSDKIDSILWVGICGDQGAKAIANVLSGEANPSGKLTQTWAAKYTDTPTYGHYEMTNIPEGLHGPEVEYVDDIYVGYRYYDTFNVTPKFPFGFGLSYTEFDTEIKEVQADSETVTVRATVQNTGDVAGKEVVQVYYSAPEGTLEKPYQELAAFGKTDLLQPKEKQTLTMTFKVKDMASYNEETAQYVLEDGEYVIRVGNSSRSTHVGAVLALDKDAVTEQLSNQMQEAIPLDRYSNDGVIPYSYEGEKEEIAAAEKIEITASDIKTEDNANRITDEPEELKDSVETEFAAAAKEAFEAKQPNTKSVGVKAKESVFEVPGMVHCADLGTNFAGFIENDPSGDVDGYKSVTVQKAGTQMPFDVDLAYQGKYSVSMRYYVNDPASVTLKDQDNRELCRLQLNETGKWATATVENVTIENVTKLQIVTNNDNINLNWLTLRTAEYAGLVKATLPSGSYKEAVSVGLYSEDCSDGVIYYTTDGSEPTAQSKKYDGKIRVEENTVLKAYVEKEGTTSGRTESFEYKIDNAVGQEAVKPVASVIGEDEAGNKRIAFRAEAGMSIFYTLDGSNPDSRSEYYTEPVSVPKGTTVKAVAIGDGCTYSQVTEVAVVEIAPPAAGNESGSTYEAGHALKLSASEGTKIYYTISTDGKEPADPTTDSEEYTSEIVLDELGKTIVKAIAVNENGLSSEVSTFVYQIVEKVYTLKDVYAGEATIEQVVAQMNLSELAEVVSNAGRSNRFMSPDVKYADGPLGVKTNNFTKWAAPSLLACSWDAQLFAEQGDAIGKEMTEEGIDFWLAPGINILRDPRSGRNPEYYAEDEVLTGVLASAVVSNVQEHNVGCVIKHYVGNDQETHRKQCANAVVSERALREIYLKAFEIVVKTSQPWALMTTYCDVNRMSTATNFELCTAIPRGEWGFEGILMTDWICYADNGMMMYAGNDLIMPSGNAEVIKNSIVNPEQVNKNDPNYTKPTTKAMLQRNVVNIFEMMTRTKAFARNIGEPQKYDYKVPEITWVSADKTNAAVIVEVKSGEHGTVSPAKQEIIVGSHADFTVKPEKGYIVDRVTVKPAAAYCLKDDKLTVKDVKSATAVTISFKEASTDADFAGLNEVIKEAEDFIANAEIGGKPGNYLPSTVDVLQDAINAAQKTANYEDASAEEVEEAISELLQAISVFQSEKLTMITHQVIYDDITKIKAIDYAHASKVIGSENCQDSDGGKNTTATYKGTYLEYLVFVDKENVYNLYGRIASDQDNCGYEVYVDGELQGSTVMEKRTGGWQSWAYIDPVKVTLPKGVHTIKIMPTHSGMNINYFTLETLMKEVIVTTDGNGTVDQETLKVEGGQDVKLTLTPNENYIADTVTVTPENDYELYRNELTVKKVRKDTKVHVTFRELPAEPDIARFQALIDEAEHLKENAVTDGEAGHYAPSTVKAFGKEIEKAKEVLGQSALTSVEMEYAIQDLEIAIQKFENSKVVKKVHIISNEGVSKVKATAHSAASPEIKTEPCHDEDGGEIPTYTEVGRWMEYTIDVAESGWFEFYSRVSTWKDAAGFTVTVDEEPLTECTNLPVTGNYQNWRTMETKLVKLDAGMHTMRIKVVGDGINFNWFKFEPYKVNSSKNALVSLIEYAQIQKDSADYANVIPVVKAAFEKALAEAIAVNENEIATQEEVDAAYEKLLDMVHMLDFIKGDTTDLQTLVNVVKGMNKELFTEDSWSAVEEALAKAEAVLADENAMQEEIDAARDALKAAKDALVRIPVDKTKLQKLVDKSKKYEDAIKAYTPGTADIFKAALANAREVLSNEDVTQKMIDEAYVMLQNAVFGLRFIPNKDKLEDLIGKARTVDVAEYTAESAAAFETALNYAEAVFADADATEEQVKAAEKALKKAQKNLVAKADADKKGNDKVTSADGNNKLADKAAKTGDANTALLAAVTAIAAFAVFMAFKKKINNNK